MVCCYTCASFMLSLFNCWLLATIVTIVVVCSCGRAPRPAGCPSESAGCPPGGGGGGEVARREALPGSPGGGRRIIITTTIAITAIIHSSHINEGRVRNCSGRRARRHHHFALRRWSYGLAEPSDFLGLACRHPATVCTPEGLLHTASASEFRGVRCDEKMDRA